ncbi:hypothetical protein PWT90_10251 [Aphanocladium album]|nr:hypothetical protein PWT90_10251 [Aphanocladium album]
MATYQATGQEMFTKYHGEIQGKVVLTIGVSPGGLGAHFLRTIAEAEPALLILAGRDTLKAQATADEIREIYPNQKMKFLLNNAGIMAVPFSLSADGYESQFASNHLGHFLFTNLIMPKILASATPRAVTVSSGAHRFGAVRFADLNFDNEAFYDNWTAYGQ